MVKLEIGLCFFVSVVVVLNVYRCTRSTVPGIY